MSLDEPLLLKGSPASPYTRKMLAVLRYRRIPYAFVLNASARANALPRPKVELLPTFYFPDGQGGLTPVTDSTPLIRRLDAERPGRDLRPRDPVVAFLDSLLEDYADEWLTKAMFHYRWSYPADIAKGGGLLRRYQNLATTDAEAAELAQTFARRQIDRLRFVGSHAGTAPVIEASYTRFLDIFEEHLRHHPFLLGRRPSACDFGVYGQLTQLAHFDPTPAAICLERAPRVHAWVSLMDDLSGEEPRDGDWFARDAIPDTIGALLKEIGRVYATVMLANAKAVRDKAEKVEAVVDGQPWAQNPFPYQAKCVLWLREEFGHLSAPERDDLHGVFYGTGIAALLET